MSDPLVAVANDGDAKHLLEKGTPPPLKAQPGKNGRRVGEMQDALLISRLESE